MRHEKENQPGGHTRVHRDQQIKIKYSDPNYNRLLDLVPPQPTHLPTWAYQFHGLPPVIIESDHE